MLTLTHELIGRFQRIVYDRSGLHFSGHKLVFFERQLRERLDKGRLDDFESYYRRLTEDPSELDLLVQGLTTNRTYFYRNPGHFKALRDTVFPEIIEAKNKEVVSSWGRQGESYNFDGPHPAMRLRVWSSGCSTGEETYSIAFSLLEALSYPRAWDVEVLGTDIKRDALASARAGVYDEASVKELPPEIAGKYMESTVGGYAVRENVSRVVKFREANLKEFTGPPPGALTLRDLDGTVETLDTRGYFDVVFCRNVMIYFDREGQQRLVDALYECLAPGGYLFTGDSEPLHLFSHGFVQAGGDESLYYRKPL